VFVLDEYCARYGVRGCNRHLCYLSDLLDRAESGIMIDPTLLHYSFAFCASHVHGNRSVLLYIIIIYYYNYTFVNSIWKRNHYPLKKQLIEMLMFSFQ
jgi:hypothetical protein